MESCFSPIADPSNLVIGLEKNSREIFGKSDHVTLHRNPILRCDSHETHH